MSVTLLHKRNSNAGVIPGGASLSLGELAINTVDGRLYIKKNDGTVILVTGEVQAAIDSLANKLGGGGGVTPFYQFYRAGTGLSSGTYLNIGSVSSASVGQLVSGTNKIVRLAITTSAAVTSVPAVIQIQRRTGVATFADIAGASISIPVGAYKANTLLTTAIALNADEELSAYIKSGSPSTPILLIFVTPV